MFRLLRCPAARGIVLMSACMLPGCGGLVPPDSDEAASTPTGSAEYLGSATCRACHPELGTLHARHGHSQALKLTEGARPDYPPEGAYAGVPDPPAGLGWPDLDFVIGGYSKAADFVDTDGFLLTDGTGGPPVQYNLRHPPTGSPAAFAALSVGTTATDDYGYECFRCHTTGAESVADNGGRRQGNRPGVGGTWAEAGVQCEACHGAGSHHVPDPSAGNIIVDASTDLCARCHVHPDRPGELVAEDGFIAGNQQVREVAASPHATFACTVCHNPHASVLYDRENGLRNTCRGCHPDRTMARHERRVFVQGDYVEFLSCESCHMPPASRTAVSASVTETGGSVARIGDTRTHIVNIDTHSTDAGALFNAEGTAVATDSDGKAAVPLHYICLRCHNGRGSAFVLAFEAASAIADGIHE